ncbi:MAG: chorismate lyase [Colwellia sp.]
MRPRTVNFPVTLAGQWQLPNDNNLSQLPKNMKDWLLDEGSLTARLKSQCDNFKVQVIGEQQQPCSAAEACKLISIGEPVLVREVLLYCDNIPQVFARSLIPLKSLTGKETALAHLGEQPLGQVLFNNPSLQRQALEISSFNCDSSVGRLANSLFKRNVTEKSLNEINAVLWGRRSIFMLEKKPLMVAEVFLPDALAYQII